MTKPMKITMVLVSLALVLLLGAELTLGWFAYNRLTEGAERLSGLREDNAAVREELTGLRGELTELSGAVSGLQEAVEEALRGSSGDYDDPGQEDDVTIAGSYHIRSTLAISDAYKSGDRSGLSDKEKETLDMAADILAQIITPEMDAYEKEEAVYVWMTEHLAHDEGLLPVIPRTQADCDNPYGVLKYHNAVCVGYATTFRLFMQMLDIECMVVHNTERYHSWDLVHLGDGWYHTDIYSDAGSASFSHFNLTDSMQSMNQSWNTAFFPAAEGYEYCYAYRVSTPEEDLYHVPAALREAIDSRTRLVSLRFDGGLIDEVGAMIVQDMLENVQSRIYNSTLDNELYMSWSWLPIGQDWLLAVSLYWYDSGSDTPTPEIPDEAYEKIYEAVEDAFGDLEQNYWYDYDSDEDYAVYTAAN